ncbi:hypothetical protein EJ03DRAFT_67095 [Teratosphaeria nubilosa]|uniref:F-box domain-containing protein n=1 Tax=Teratosphaeria nubilosa TaxID=161662 RepID=A0A6G1LBT8_9PEZI|nr:hypothetical protein EJ03DRAFT_67095 [Teratosphaeria nubilosa]
MEPDPGLFKLPADLRIQIYEYLLRFDHPIKRRTLVTGSPNTALLRVSRSWHNDALPVLYSLNRVVATRNDFCSNTDESLRTPVFGEHLQHVLINNFGSSMACYFLTKTCDACDIAAPGLLAALQSMPRLKTVLVDFTSQQSTFRLFAEALPATHPDLRLKCTAVGSYSLTGPPDLAPSLHFPITPACTGLANTDGLGPRCKPHADWRRGDTSSASQS